MPYVFIRFDGSRRNGPQELSFPSKAAAVSYANSLGGRTEVGETEIRVYFDQNY
jgi:hypothetical protein